MTDFDWLKVKIFADGADKKTMLELHSNPLISGFTTNPSLMHKAGVENYTVFAKEIAQTINHHPISFEVFSDDFDEMYEQAQKITRFGENVYVKIPITNTKGESSSHLIEQLSKEKIKLNITAMMTMAQVEIACHALHNDTPAFLSIFAGRIADTGRDPLPLMQEAVNQLKTHPQFELIWASPRELLNIIQANQIGCHIITVTQDILKKLTLVGKDLTQYSLETVQQFHEDAITAGYQL